MTTIELYEPYDDKIFKIIQRNKDKIAGSQFGCLKVWQKTQKNGFVKVTYTDLKEGRLSFHLDNDKHSGINLGGMDTRVRSAFASGKLRDFDIENCHPTILCQLAKKNKIKCPNLDDYCQNRKTYFDIHGKNLKTRILSWINGGKYNEDTDDLNDFYDEVNRVILKLISKLDSFKEISKITDTKERNKKIRSLRAGYLQDFEKKILLCMYNCCIKNDIKVATLIHDGFMVYKNTTPDNFSKLLEKEIKEELNFKVKIVEKPIPKFEISDWTDDLIIETDCEAVELLLTIHPNIVKSNGTLYILKENLWVRDDDYIKKIILQSGIKKCGRNGPIPYSANVNGCLNIFKTLTVKLDDTPNFVTKMNENTLGYVFYKNGYYSLKDGKFIDRMDKSTLIRIERDYIDYKYHPEHPHIKDVNDKLFCCLGTDELIQYYCKAVSRAIGGYICDKVGYILTGERNSGKGTLNTSLDLTFEKYITTIPPPMTKSQVSDTKSNSFLIDKQCDLARISYSNEGISKDGKVTLDGNLLKGMCSGGDKVPCRTNYTNTSDVVNNTALFLSFNKVPQADPADALTTFKIIPFPYSYTPKPNPKIKNERLAFDIKNYIKKSEYFVPAFEWIIYNAFINDPITTHETPEECQIEKEIIEEDNISDFSSCFNKYFEFDDEFYIKSSELHFLFAEKLKMSAVKTSRSMKKAGYQRIKKRMDNRTVWVYTGLKIKRNEDEDEDEDEDEEY